MTSRPQHSSARSHGAAAFSVRIQQAPQQQLARLPVATAGPGGASHPAPNAGPQRFPQQSPRQPQPAPRPAASPAGGAAALPAAPAPLQVLRRLDTLRLYGPSSLSSSPPPLALLLPQPGLRRLKLSACASHANLRALGAQTGLQKLIVSHTAVPQLYPMLQALPLAPQQLAPPQQAQLLLQQQPLPAGASILGFHSEVCCPADWCFNTATRNLRGLLAAPCTLPALDVHIPCLLCSTRALAGHPKPDVTGHSAHQGPARLHGRQPGGPGLRSGAPALPGRAQAALAGHGVGHGAAHADRGVAAAPPQAVRAW